MTDAEYDIIDELYFVTPYLQLAEQTELEEDLLKTTLITLIEKGWVRVYKSVSEESEMNTLDLNANYKSYFYLASKKGLFEHNSR